MTLNIKILPQAERSLKDIETWTRDAFGEDQARKYCGILRSRFREIAEGRTFAKPLMRLTALDRHIDINACPTGRHYVLFKVVKDRLYIIDVIHQRRNLFSFYAPDLDDA